MGGRGCTVAIDVYSFGVLLWEASGRSCEFRKAQKLPSATAAPGSLRLWAGGGCLRWMRMPTRPRPLASSPVTHTNNPARPLPAHRTDHHGAAPGARAHAQPRRARRVPAGGRRPDVRVLQPGPGRAAQREGGDAAPARHAGGAAARPARRLLLSPRAPGARAARWRALGTCACLTACRCQCYHSI